MLVSENVTSGEHHLHISSADPAPGFEVFVKEVAGRFGSSFEGGEVEQVKMDDWNTDWIVLYPFSAVRSHSSSLFSFRLIEENSSLNRTDSNYPLIRIIPPLGRPLQQEEGGSI